MLAPSPLRRKRSVRRRSLKRRPTLGNGQRRIESITRRGQERELRFPRISRNSVRTPFAATTKNSDGDDACSAKEQSGRPRGENESL